MSKWLERIESKQSIDRIDEIPLTWELAKGQIAFLFASYKLQRDTQTAATWYRRAIEIAGPWNAEIEAGPVSEKMLMNANYRIVGAITQLDHAIKRLTLVAKLPPLPAYAAYPTLTPANLTPNS